MLKRDAAYDLCCVQKVEHSHCLDQADELLASTWCMVPQNSHVAKLFPHQVISDDEFHVSKVLKPSLLSIFKSLCINLLTGLRASLLVQHVHFQQSRERQNTRQRES